MNDAIGGGRQELLNEWPPLSCYSVFMFDYFLKTEQSRGCTAASKRKSQPQLLHSTVYLLILMYVHTHE